MSSLELGIVKVNTKVVFPDLSEQTSAVPKLFDTSFSDQSDLFAGTQLLVNIPNWSGYVNGTAVKISAVAASVADSANWDVSTYTIASNRAGKDFYIYAKSAGGFIFSANSTYPTGYTGSNTRKIGGFHCLCLSVGTISGHTLTGYVTGDVLPRTVWDKFNRSSSIQEGSFLSACGKWVQIYLPSFSGGKLVSVNGGTIADGGNGWHCYKFEQYFAQQGMQTISQAEFFAASHGANQSTNISGSADPGTTGGHTDTAGRRMISNEGMEDCCGVIWQWSRDQGGNITSAAWANAFDGNDSGVGGQHYQAPYRALLGGNGNDGVVCGSRGSLWSTAPLLLGAGISSRGVAEPAKHRF